MDFEGVPGLARQPRARLEQVPHDVGRDDAPPRCPPARRPACRRPDGRASPFPRRTRRPESSRSRSPDRSLTICSETAPDTTKYTPSRSSPSSKSRSPAPKVSGRVRARSSGGISGRRGNWASRSAPSALRRRERALLLMLQRHVHGIGHGEPVTFRHVPDAGDQLVLDRPPVFFRGAVDQAVLDAEVAVAERRRDRLRLLEDALGLAHQLRAGPAAPCRADPGS